MDPSVADGSASKKRFAEESDEFEEFGAKRAKIRDLESVFRSEGKIKHNIASAIDLNGPSCADDTTLSQSKMNCVKSRGLAFDLNIEDDQDQVKPRDSLSECGSTCHLGGERDSMRVWNEMKRNGFLSSSHGGVPVPQAPKPRGRKKGKELVIKKKIEIAKKEQVDRFAKVAAPSGLLNELNPGIINHVRNRKQVHSIIENLVRSARSDSKRGEGEEVRDDLAMKDREVVAKTSHYASFNKLECEDDTLALKHSSSGTLTSNVSSLSNEESGNVSTVNSLSVRAASVASQWLELLQQDIKGRLAALRRSRKRVQAAIQRELPLLVSRELVFNQENTGNADLHRARWGPLFDQMDNALSEEEKHLESSLNQVNEMLMHCNNGLLQFHPEHSLQKQTIDYRNLKAEPSAYKDLAVQAAAAAIYSTSNFLRSMENLPCF
ncbi:hypothetical protein HanRHA438_Chr09g0395091 [Helianthus annuus]|uniref:Uncharacterized protein n=2 Tax=Helianthus annuus TaxID=4232 RepID=A0A9K3I5L6_HELAN|nr:uncharacterized protein LOC110878102 isoform X2 [Helianthus annuus]KAF5790455.1 hypothetical protein HanXRQr2_Chr09g0383451 [Helianthus annuus]KAJ0525670.1 hypothetical protein HanHA300_Chr09g0314731 [Helianthus annuus]KAJ0533891.1 hypothetical protein HanIR_Chr09g0413621 [Helianthus annuus]KAJ0542054.1 hypothetical protein HanHA89_Chr09g0335611 [Helianthus annuus]KAJ0707118.1 hypothetical protein HanLR1_Chr09g0314951 [Helianthus annuus]